MVMLLNPLIKCYGIDVYDSVACPKSCRVRIFKKLPVKIQIGVLKVIEISYMQLNVVILLHLLLYHMFIFT